MRCGKKERKRMKVIEKKRIGKGREERQEREGKERKLKIEKC